MRYRRCPQPTAARHDSTRHEQGKGPSGKTTKTKATFTFTTEDGGTFECKLDKKPATICTSPFKVTKLKKGRHTLTVTAIDAAGNRDPSPTTYKFKVVKKKQPKGN